MLTNGVTIINNAVKTFTATIKQLEAGVSACQSRKEKNRVRQDEIATDSANLDVSIDKGNRIIKKINEILE